ncbi:hypothetical protein IFO70_21105 [Phormidium tenue FACHB-886]|nr:hypothetical protein [Phormidium tenue FACHB-886]
MYVERMGCLGYRLYRLGWRSALYGDRALFWHILLSAFLHYRRGFISGAQWAKEYYPQEKLHP